MQNVLQGIRRVREDSSPVQQLKASRRYPAFQIQAPQRGFCKAISAVISLLSTHPGFSFVLPSNNTAAPNPPAAFASPSDKKTAACLTAFFPILYNFFFLQNVDRNPRIIQLIIVQYFMDVVEFFLRKKRGIRRKRPNIFPWASCAHKAAMTNSFHLKTPPQYRRTYK